ncbi:hypothetical protein EMIT0P218_30457 [Pseudomonas sp. IT-P218]
MIHRVMNGDISDTDNRDLYYSFIEISSREIRSAQLKKGRAGDEQCKTRDSRQCATSRQSMARHSCRFFGEPGRDWPGAIRLYAAVASAGRRPLV